MILQSPFDPPGFFVTPTCTRHLLNIAEEQIAWEDEIIAQAEAVGDSFEWPNEFDVNDSFIWRSFIRDPLLDALTEGFESHNLLGKGLGWLLGSIPSYLTSKQGVSDAERQELMTLYNAYEQWMKVQQAAWLEPKKPSES